MNIKAMREALEWYADPKNWWTENAGSMGFHNTNMDGSMERLNSRCGVPVRVNGFANDCGSTARAALLATTKNLDPQATDLIKKMQEQNRKWGYFDHSHNFVETTIVGDIIDVLSRMSSALEKERSDVAEAVTHLKRAIASRSHLRFPGRGSYAWDDERYQKEFGDALDEIDKALRPMEIIAGNWLDCPRDQDEIRQARDYRFQFSYPKWVRSLDIDGYTAARMVFYSKGTIDVLQGLERALAAYSSFVEANAYIGAKKGTDIIEECLKVAVAGEHQNAPFPLDANEAKIWHKAQAAAYQHALEMMAPAVVPVPEIKTVIDEIKQESK